MTVNLKRKPSGSLYRRCTQDKEVDKIPFRESIPYAYFHEVDNCNEGFQQDDVAVNRRRFLRGDDQGAFERLQRIIGHNVERYKGPQRSSMAAILGHHNQVCLISISRRLESLGCIKSEAMCASAVTSLLLQGLMSSIS